jgi:hypothetical protein
MIHQSGMRNGIACITHSTQQGIKPLRQARCQALPAVTPLRVHHQNCSMASSSKATLLQHRETRQASAARAASVVCLVVQQFLQGVVLDPVPSSRLVPTGPSATAAPGVNNATTCSTYFSCLHHCTAAAKDSQLAAAPSCLEPTGSRGLTPPRAVPMNGERLGTCSQRCTQPAVQEMMSVKRGNMSALHDSKHFKLTATQSLRTVV